MSNDEIDELEDSFNPHTETAEREDLQEKNNKNDVTVKADKLDVGSEDRSGVTYPDPEGTCPSCQFQAKNALGLASHARQKHPAEYEQNSDMFGGKAKIPKKPGKSMVPKDKSPIPVPAPKVVSPAKLTPQWEDYEKIEAGNMAKDNEILRLRAEKIRLEEQAGITRNRFDNRAGNDAISEVIHGQSNQIQSLMELIAGKNNPPIDNARSDKLEEKLEKMEQERWNDMKDSIKDKNSDIKRLEEKIDQVEKNTGKTGDILEKAWGLFENQHAYTIRRYEKEDEAEIQQESKGIKRREPEEGNTGILSKDDGNTDIYDELEKAGMDVSEDGEEGEAVVVDYRNRNIKPKKLYGPDDGK